MQIEIRSVLIALAVACCPVPVPLSAQGLSLDDGVNAIERGDHAQGLLVFRRLADEGNRTAAFNLGVMHEQGLGVGRDIKVAAQWYQLAAERGDIQGQLAMGKLHENGIGVAKDMVAARFWYGKVAASNAPDATGSELVAQARERLAALPQPRVEFVSFEGGRYVFIDTAGDRCMIALQGYIGTDTTRQFAKVVERAKALGCKSPIIALESGGGRVADGIALGREMYFEGYSTAVNRSCASSCGLVFMGGRERILIGPQARIGLHQASVVREPGGDTLRSCYSDRYSDVYKQIRRFLRMSLAEQSEAVFERIIATPCTSVEWVSGQKAQEMGIATRLD